MRGTSDKSGVAYKRDAYAAVAGAHGAPNPPSPPNAAGLPGEVGFSWTEAAPFTRYDIEYVIGPDTDTPAIYHIDDVTSIFRVAVPNGTVVKARLWGWAGEFKYHDPSAWDEAAATTAASTDDRPPSSASKGELIAWLAAHGVTGVGSLTKPELWSLIDDLLDDD